MRAEPVSDPRIQTFIPPFPINSDVDSHTISYVFISCHSPSTEIVFLRPFSNISKNLSLEPRFLTKMFLTRGPTLLYSEICCKYMLSSILSSLSLELRASISSLRGVVREVQERCCRDNITTSEPLRMSVSLFEGTTTTECMQAVHLRVHVAHL